MLKSVLSVSLALGLATPGFAASAGVGLTLNYGKSRDWTYAMDYESACRFSEKGTESAKKTDVQCLLTGSVAEAKDAIRFKVTELVVGSELYGEETKAEMVKKLTEAEYTLPLKDGTPSVDGLTDLLAEGLPEWNLYVQFAKLLPELPAQPAKKGFTWERSGELEVHTAQGMVPCEVYRRFQVDRLSAEKDTAFITWSFRYTAAKGRQDTSTLLKYVPVAGKGTGTAVVHVGEGYLVRASMTFETPVAEVGKTKVTWNETASIELKPVK